MAAFVIPLLPEKLKRKRSNDSPHWSTWRICSKHSFPNNCRVCSATCQGGPSIFETGPCSARRCELDVELEVMVRKLSSRTPQHLRLDGSALLPIALHLPRVSSRCETHPDTEYCRSLVVTLVACSAFATRYMA